MLLPRRLLLATALAGAAAFGAAAAELLDGAAIRALVSGNTVQGTMSDASAYTEHYAADGTIRGADYTGTWTIEGDRMCFAYGEAPTCYGVRRDGDRITWVGADGTDQGTGTVVAGNPNNF